MPFGKKAREERARVQREGGTLSGRQAKKLVQDQTRGRVVDGKVYDTKGRVMKDLNKGR